MGARGLAIDKPQTPTERPPRPSPRAEFAVSSLFSPKVPKPKAPEPPPPPITVNDDLLEQQTLDRTRKKKGRASTMLSAPAGGGGAAPAKVSLGS
jgi:hypothetical protein